MSSLIRPTIRLRMTISGRTRWLWLESQDTTTSPVAPNLLLATTRRSEPTNRTTARYEPCGSAVMLGVTIGHPPDISRTSAPAGEPAGHTTLPMISTSACGASVRSTGTSTELGGPATVSNRPARDPSAPASTGDERFKGAGGFWRNTQERNPTKTMQKQRLENFITGDMPGRARRIELRDESCEAMVLEASCECSVGGRRRRSLYPTPTASRRSSLPPPASVTRISSALPSPSASMASQVVLGNTSPPQP